MTTEIGRSCPLSWQSPCLASNSKASCWKRYIKRKSNDGSGLQVEGFIMPKTEGANQNISHESSRGTMSWISHCTQKDSCNMRKSRSIDVFQHEKLVKSSQSSLRASRSGILSQKTCFAAESDPSHLDNSTNCPSANYSVQSEHIQGSGQGLLSKKRVHVVMTEESACWSEHPRDKASQDEIIRLREALKIERKALRKLHRELEQERCASAVAATEALAMIRRLQQEKSAALVESRHYRLASEERETYNQEAIALLKEALSVMENEVRTLQRHEETYRSMLLKIKSGQGNHLEGSGEEEQLLSLERNKMAPFSLVNSNEFLNHSPIGIRDVTEEQVLGDIMKWHHYPSEVTSQQPGHVFEDTYCESHKSDLETNDVSGAQDLDDVSISILDRVARLEERFACLGHNQAFDSHCSGRGLGESEAVRIVEQHSSPVISGNFEKLREGFVADNYQDVEGSKDFDCTDFGRVTVFGGSAVEGCEVKSRGFSRGWPKDSGCEATFPDAGDAEIDGFHDVYEVQWDPNSCAMLSCDASLKSRAGSTDINIGETLHASQGKLDEQRSSFSVKDTTPLEGRNAPADGKPFAEERSGDGEAIKSSVATENVCNLKLRLQALEGERAFMKVAIDSLRKENMELKLLQDIAQQLRELKGDVWKTRPKGHGSHEQSPILSFLQGILSFVGMQSNAATKKRRFFYPCQESSKSSYKEQGQAGLSYLLNYPSEEERHLCVMRECKVKLGNA